MNKFLIKTKYPSDPSDNTPLYCIARKAGGDTRYREMDGTTTPSKAVAEGTKLVLVKRQELEMAENELIRLKAMHDDSVAMAESDAPRDTGEAAE